MADNVSVNTNTAATGAVNVDVAADVIAGVAFQRFKPAFGVDGVATDVSATDPLPVVQTGTPALPTGAATAAKQPALGTAGSASADVITVQGISSGTALAISAAALPLPTGASTAAKQPALGTAGTASSDVLTVQGIASMTALKVDGSAVTQPISGSLTNIAGTISLPTGASTSAIQSSVIGTKTAGTAAASAVLTGGLYNTTLPTLTNAQQAALQLDSSGRLIVSPASLIAGSAIVGKVGIDQTTDGTTNKVAADLRLAGTAVTAGAGAVASGTPRVTLASDDPLVAKLPTALATGGGLKVTVQDTSGTALDYTVPALIEGKTAAAASITAKPVTIGGQAKTANPTAVTDGQVVNTTHDKVGKLIAVSALRDLKAVQTTTITSSTSETTIITAAGASVFADLYGLILTNTSASAQIATIKDATAGTTRLTIEVPAGDTRGFMLDAGSAITQAAANNNWTCTCTSSLASLLITALYVKNT